MAKPSITTRAGKGAALTYTELDNNFSNIKDATITITGGSTAVSADLNGNITLVAGTNVTITGNNGSKEITISASSGGGGGSMNGFTISGDTGSAQSITDANNVSIVGGTGLTSVASATDTITINLDNTSVTAGSYTVASITVDAQGRITSASSGSAGLTNPLTADLDLGSYVIKDTNSALTLQSNNGVLVKSITYSDAELTISPGDGTNVISRISTKEGELVINTNSGGVTKSLITLSDDGSSIHLHSNNNTDGYVLIGSGADGVIRLFPITTTERNARATQLAGMLIFNSSTSKFQGHTGSGWVDLH